MPVNLHRKLIFFPEEEIPLVRYMSLAKFISLIDSHALFFCRLDKFDDVYEGTSPEANQIIRHNWYPDMVAAGHFPESGRTEEIAQSVKEQINQFEQLQRKLICINCWNIAYHESAALWKLYAEEGCGIMIRSSKNQLIKAFETSEEEIWLSAVKYVDFETKNLDGNILFPAIHKHQFYRYEEEVRLI